MSSTTTIDWPDGLTWCTFRGEVYIAAVKKGLCNSWSYSPSGILWVEEQGRAIEFPLSYQKPRQFVLPLEYLT